MEKSHLFVIQKILESSDGGTRPPKLLFFTLKNSVEIELGELKKPAELSNALFYKTWRRYQIS